MEIPKQIADFNFVLIGGDGKQPIEKAWQKKIHKKDSEQLQEYLKNGGNYGVQPNNSSVIIDGKTYFLIMVDFDTKEFQDKVIDKFPETFTTTSGSPKQCLHLWFASDNNKAFKVKDENLNTLADLIGAGNQIIAPGSKHNSGSVYSIVNDVPISFIPYTELEAILKTHDKSPNKIIKPKKEYTPKGISGNIIEDIMDSISMEEVLQEVGIDTSKNPTNCFAHSSQGGKCLGFDDTTAHCFHCDGSWNKFSLIREAKKLSNKDTFDWFAEKTGKVDELKQVREEYSQSQKPSKDFEEVTGIKEAAKVFTLEGQAERFNEIQPLFYDRAGMWWLWNDELKCWEVSDEVDILNMISQTTGRDVISSTKRTEILNSLKQKGRLNIPKAIKPTWVQFRDIIVDIKTGEEFKASPEFFVTNPIPWELHQDKFVNTPIMDKVFTEWVGEEYIQTLYEILAYCLIPDYPLHRLFCFIGGGMNGKSCFLNLLRKFIGENNVTATELDTLLSSRFEVTRLHKKLVCIMGETNFAEMSKTSVLKKLTGQDIIGFEYKNKNPFEGENYAKILIATNNLPTTTDKTVGFYRRWCIIDFPNQFSEKKDILNTIPDEEYRSLAIKSLSVIKNLLDKREFHKEGTIEERTKKYEDKSDPLEKFMKEFTDDEIEGHIFKWDFEKKLNEWCKENRFRQIASRTIATKMKEKGFEDGRIYGNWFENGLETRKQFRAWTGIKWKIEEI